MRGALISAFLFAMAGREMAQDLSHFEVASIKPSTLTSPIGVPAPILQGGPGTADPGQITYRGIALGPLIFTAYGVKPFQVSAPGQMNSERYDIIAKIPPGATPEQFKLMLQNLLADRFNLLFHHESRILPVYALVVEKNGPKLKESAKIAPNSGQPQAVKGPDANGFPTLPPSYTGVVGFPSNGHMRLTGQRAPLSQLTQMLGLDRPIVDETGLTGDYDFKLDFEWRFSRAAQPADNASDPAPSVFAALETLGLKLEAKKVPFDVLVIDHLDKQPTAN
jgi:uncharacterized protein (TIGR03435 family)